MIKCWFGGNRFNPGGTKLYLNEDFEPEIVQNHKTAAESQGG